MADSVEILPEIVKIKLDTPRVSARVLIPKVPSSLSENRAPVVIVPGLPGPPGPPGPPGNGTGGGVVIDDGTPSLSRVWSSQHTHDQDVEVVDSLTPDVDLTILFNNALA